MLAELVLSDTDSALISEGYEHSRYVDDFVIMLRKGQDAYAALAFLAEQLAMTEGLTLSTVKTRIRPVAEFTESLSFQSGEDSDQASDSAAERLLWQAYESEDIDQNAVEGLKTLDLVGELTQEVSKDYWEPGKIRILLRALRLAKNPEAIEYLKLNIRSLLPFIKDVVLLMDELRGDGVNPFSDMGAVFESLILDPAVRRLPVVRVWLLEAFVRGIVPINSHQVRRLSVLSETLDIRQIHLLYGILGDVNYFRRGKTRVHEMSDWLKISFIYSARCLPQDEFETWLGNIRGSLNFPLSNQFCKWVSTDRK